MSNPKPTRGGKRPGSGRKPRTEQPISFSFKLPPAVAKRLREAKGNLSYPKLIEKLLALEG